MCIDFTDLNKVCPKDPYPLPNIDKLINGAGFKKLSFKEAYFGYNQIRKCPGDAQKTTFMKNISNYYFDVMPFRAKTMHE